MLSVAQATGPEFQVNTYTSGAQELPGIASDSLGDNVVVWQSYGQDGSGYGIFAQRYNSAGIAQGSEFQVNTYTTGNQMLASVAMDAAGDFVVAWESYGEDGSEYGIYAQRYNSAGAAAGTEFLVNSYTTGTQQVPSVAMDTAGDFVVAWQSSSGDGSGFGIYAQQFSASGTPEGSQFQVNTYTTGDQRRPAVAADALGDFVIAWQSSGEDGSDYGVYAQRYNSTGSAQGSQFQVNTYTTNSQRFVAAAMDAGGDFVFTWSSYGEDGSGYGIYSQRYSSTGAALGSEFQVNTFTKNSQTYSGVAMDSAGDFVVTWTGGGSEDGSGFGVFGQRYNAAGAAQGDEFRINTYTTGNQGLVTSTHNVGQPSVTMDAAGDFVTAWSSYGEDGSSYGIYAQRYVNPQAGSSPAALGSEYRVNTYTTNSQSIPRIASDAVGDYVVVWQSPEDGGSLGVYAQRYNAAGVAQGSEFRVNTYTTGNQYAPTVAMDSAGDFVVAWNSVQDGSGSGVFAQRFNPLGVAQGSEFQVNTYTTGNQWFPSAAMDAAGDFVVSWMSYGQDGSTYGVYAQRYNSSGTAQGSEFQVNTYTTGDQKYPSAAMDSAGDFVIAFINYASQDGSGAGVFAQRYSASGTKQGSVFQVNTYTTGTQKQPEVAMDSAGDFVVGWLSYGEDGSQSGIYAQRYNSSGIKSGSEFRVNTYTAGTQYWQLPSGTTIAMDATGDFVVTWGSYGQDGSNYGIYAQRYNSSGATLGSEFRVNTYTSNVQTNAVVAMDSQGDFVIAWESYGQDGGNYGIYSQRYGFSTPPAITTSSGPLAYAANSGAQAIGPGLTLADGQNTFINNATVSISAGYVSGEDVLGFTDQNGITGIFNNASGTLVLSGAATIANYQTALQSITYTDAAHDASTANRTVTFTANDGITTSAAATQTINPQADVVSQLVITGQPPTMVTAGSNFGLTVVAEDVDGAVVPDYTGSVSLALAGAPAGGTLGGVTSVNATSGVAVFSGATLNLAGSGYTLQASNGTFTSATSNAISVTPGTATQLLITTEPLATVTAGSPFGFTVTAEDAEGNLATGFSGSETVALANRPGGGTLSGTLVVSATGGVTTFSSLTLNLAGGGYTLAVTSGTLSSATSSAISVTPGAASQLLITAQPPATVTAGDTFGLTVTAEDAEGNIATGFTGNETVALAVNPGSASLGGTLVVNAVAGVAGYSGLSLNMPGSGYTLQLSAGGLTSAVSSAIDVPPVLMITGTSNSNDDVAFTFTSANQFSVSSGGTTTPYSTTNFSQVVYNAPVGSFSEFVFDDPGGAIDAIQSLGSTTLTIGGFSFLANGTTNLYLYGGPGSTATVNVDNGASASSNFFVVDTKNDYSYIADPGTGAYSELSGFGSETVTGSAGTTYAYLYSTSQATTVASPTQTTFTVGGVTSTLSNFPQVYVVGAADGTDSVTLDSSGGTFVGTPQFSYVSGTANGTTFLLGALYAAQVTGQASNSGKDTAVFYSYPNDTFTGTPGTSSLAGGTTNVAGSSIDFVSQALGFSGASVFQSGSGSDVADLSSSGHGSFFGTDTASILTVGASSITINTYFVNSGQTLPVSGQIVVTGNHDGTDQAAIYDSPGNNALTASGSTATLTTALGSLSIIDFGSVTAEQQNGSHDTVHETAIDFALQLEGNWTHV